MSQSQKVHKSPFKSFREILQQLDVVSTCPHCHAIHAQYVLTYFEEQYAPSYLLRLLTELSPVGRNVFLDMRAFKRGASIIDDQFRKPIAEILDVYEHPYSETVCALLVSQLEGKEM